MRLSFIIALCLAVFACKKEEKDKETRVGSVAKVEFSNETALRALPLTATPTEDDPVYYTPDVFKIKILSVAIKEEKETTERIASMIYVNPDCEYSELETPAENYSPEVPAEDRVYYQYIGMEKDCYADEVDEFFDLARSADEVNEDLNSQDLPMLPSKYKYVSIAFCYQNYDHEPTVLFQTEGMDEEAGLIKPGTCGLDSAEIDPPLEIKAGETVTVKLNYTMEDLFMDKGPEFNYDPYMDVDGNTECYLSDDESVRRCVQHDLLNIEATLADR